MHRIIFLLAAFAATSVSAADAIVKDGNTIQLGLATYRLNGVDAPAIDQMCVDEHADPWACGVEARDQLAKLIDKRSIACQDLGPDKTYLRRKTGICTIVGGNTSLNQLLIRLGYALNFEPDAEGRFNQDEAGAKADRRGLWKGCFVAPHEFRHWEKAGVLLGAACRSDKDRELRGILFPDEPTMPPGCTIKAKFAVRARATGHVGIFNIQGCRSYSALTKPDRWFCSEEDAQAENFRKAYNCRRPK